MTVQVSELEGLMVDQRQQVSGVSRASRPAFGLRRSFMVVLFIFVPFIVLYCIVSNFATPYTALMPTGSNCPNLYISNEMGVYIRAFAPDGMLNVQRFVPIPWLKIRLVPAINCCGIKQR